ncbi:DUF4190 domain-containing protein [Pseudonocardia sichuanensis]
MTAPQHPYGYAPHYAPPAPRNGLGLAAMILGIVALPFTLTGLTAWISIILGLIAVPLALAGLGRVRKGRATNKGVTIAGLVLGVLAVVAGIASTVATINAVGEALDGPSATVVGEQQTAGAPAEVSGPVALGTAVDVDGLTITVTEIVKKSDIGKTLTCANVSYANTGDDVAHRNPMDWSVRNPQGASVSSWIYTGDDALNSGELASGGTDSGIVCFDVPRDEVAVVEYSGTFLSSGPTAEWNAG